MIDFTQNESDVEWVCRKLEVQRGYFGACSTIVVKDDSGRKAVFIYSAFNGVNCEVTLASDTKQWMRDKYLRMLLAYPFRQLKCKRITMLIRTPNKTTINAVKRLGFREEGILRKFMESGEDVTIMGLLKEEYEMSKYNV